MFYFIVFYFRKAVRDIDSPKLLLFIYLLFHFIKAVRDIFTLKLFNFILFLFRFHHSSKTKLRLFIWTLFHSFGRFFGFVGLWSAAYTFSVRNKSVFSFLTASEQTKTLQITVNI